MKLVCAMASVIYNDENPRQSIHRLRAAGIHEIMFDFGVFAPLHEILTGRERNGKKYRPQAKRRAYQKCMEGLREKDFLPSIARLPFIDSQMDSDSLGDREIFLQIQTDCMEACTQIGCKTIIVQPLQHSSSKNLWEENRDFFLALASRCPDSDTRILFTNQCRSQNGHLVRGVCSDAVTAAAWVDGLNREVGMQRFGFCLDLGVCNLCGQDIQRMTSVLGERICAVILTENDGQHMSRLLPFTCAQKNQDTMDWLGAVRGLRETAFDGDLILEATDTALSFSPLLRYELFPMYKALFDYFVLQINMEKDLKKYKRVALFGAGNMCRNYMKCYGEKYPPLFTCDNNPRLWGTELEGLAVKEPEALKDLPQDCGVIICNTYYHEIAAQLQEMGIQNIGYFNDEYMPSYYYDRLQREAEQC